MIDEERIKQIHKEATAFKEQLENLVIGFGLTQPGSGMAITMAIMRQACMNVNLLFRDPVEARKTAHELVDGFFDVAENPKERAHAE